MRIMRLVALGLGMAGVSGAAMAELPPHHQRAAELRAVLEHPGVVGAFGIRRPVERIEYVRRDLYRVSAGRCRMDVAIVGRPLPPGVVGGRRFDVRPGRIACR